MQRKILVPALLLACLMPGVWAALAVWTRVDGGTIVPGATIALRDFLGLWTGGKLAATGGLHTLYTPDLYLSWLHARVNPGAEAHIWAYPPTMLLAGLPFSALSPMVGFIAYGAVTLCLFTLLARLGGVPWLVCLAAASSPAALENFLDGQSGALTGALMVGGLLLSAKRPVLGGGLLGCLSVKPHLGLLVPMILAARRNWIAAAAASAVAIALGLTSLAAFGPEPWTLLASQVSPYMIHAVLETAFDEAVNLHGMASPFIFARWNGAGIGEAYGFQAVATVVAAAITWNAWRLPNADPLLRVALTVPLAIAASPYSFCYDTVGTALAIAIVARHALANRFLPGETVALLAAWVWPAISPWAVAEGFPPIGGLLAFAVATFAWQRLSGAGVAAAEAGGSYSKLPVAVQPTTEVEEAVT